MREGADAACNCGASSCSGESFLLFRDALLSRESESDASPEDSNDCSESEDEPDASSETALVVADPAWAIAAIIAWYWADVCVVRISSGEADD